MNNRLLLLVAAASLAMGCVSRDTAPANTGAAHPTHHHAWWLGLHESRVSLDIGPGLVARCPDVRSAKPSGSEAWWHEVIDGLVACGRAGRLHATHLVMRAHLHDVPAKELRRYVGDLSSTLALALETAEADTPVHTDFAITPERALHQRVAIELALEHAH